MAVIAGIVFAQTPRSASPGIYTQGQADRGKRAYDQQCASCHGATLSGGDEAPALQGDAFLATWRSRSVGAIFEKIQSSMPPDQPGSLGPQKSSDVLGYILAVNKLPAGNTELSNKSDALRQTLLQQAPVAEANAASSASSGPDASWSLVEGQPIERRPPEKADDRPEFPRQTRAPYHASAPYRVTTLIDNLPAPWSLAFLPDGKILLTERLPGSLRILDKKGDLSGPIAGAGPLAAAGADDIGMLDVVLDPNFATNHRIFLSFFDYIGGTDSITHIARARLDEASLSLSDVKVIFSGEPTIPSKRLGAKTGGRIVIAPDGSLFMPIGDRSDSPPWDVAQRMDSDLGKIIHITPDGDPAPDNPFLGKPGVLPEIWAYGTRSQEGLAFDPATGRLWETEHGPRGGDELNIIEKGKNYGWPIVVHGIDYPGKAIGQGITHQEGFVSPVYYWDPVIAPSGLAFYTGNLFPQWKGSLFVGGLRGMILDRLTIQDDQVVAEEPLLTDLHARIRDVRVGPDGAVYVLTDSGTSSMSPHTPPTSKLLKLTPR